MGRRVMWMVRAAQRGVMADEFLEKGVLAIGWMELGDLSEIHDRQKIIDMAHETYPDHKDKHNLVSGSQVYSFGVGPLQPHETKDIPTSIGARIRLRRAFSWMKWWS